jgi:CRP/FNR family transcriptional regulator, anaerobic regulatory protein
MISHAEDLWHALHAFYPLDVALKQRLQRIFTQKHYARNHFLVKPGSPARHAWFVRKGAVRAYLLDKARGTEVISWLWLDGDLVWASDSFCRRLPTRLFIQLLEDSVLQVVSRQDLDHTLEHFPQYRHLERAVAESFHHRLHQHYHRRVSLPAMARYQHLLQTRPQLFLRVPVKDIASFLGMFPDTLSRLRGKR